jgi:hypothetical protein
VLQRLANEMPACEIRVTDRQPPLVWNAGQGAEAYAVAGVAPLKDARPPDRKP